MNQTVSQQTAGGYTPPIRLNHLIGVIVENLGKEDSEEFLQTLAEERFQKVLATVNNVLATHLQEVSHSDGVSQEAMHIVRHQCVAGQSLFSELVAQGLAYAAGTHPRFKTKKD